LALVQSGSTQIDVSKEQAVLIAKGMPQESYSWTVKVEQRLSNFQILDQPRVQHNFTQNW